MLIDNFGGLDKVFDLERESISGMFKNEKMIDSVMRDLKNLKEKILVGKSL